MRNKLLYNKLTGLYGDVLIANEGGEEEDYRICCPFCGDTRHRLYIGCKWGVFDPITSRSNEHLIYCFNEKCLNPDSGDIATVDERLERRRDFLWHVYRGLNNSVNLLPAAKKTILATEPLSWPGKVIRLDKLAAKKPNHPAVTYMQGRGFDPKQLGEEYGFVFCDKVTDQTYAPALGTILMPIYRNDVLYSWISRRIGDGFEGTARKVKKYYNCPGRPLQSVGYNLDTVLQYSTIVIVEGILDAVKTGPFATCLFTKSLNLGLKKKIVQTMQRQHGDCAVVVVMLDPYQDEKERCRGSKHHIEVVSDAFTGYIPNVLRVYLPSGCDPGSMTAAEIMQQMQKAARKARIRLNFTL